MNWKSCVKDYLKPVAVGVSITYIGGFTVWLFDMQKLMSQLVEQNKSSLINQQRNERNIDTLDKRVDDHEVRIKVIESK